MRIGSATPKIPKLEDIQVPLEKWYGAGVRVPVYSESPFTPEHPISHITITSEYSVSHPPRSDLQNHFHMIPNQPAYAVLFRKQQQGNVYTCSAQTLPKYFKFVVSWIQRHGIFRDRRPTVIVNKVDFIQRNSTNSLGKGSGLSPVSLSPSTPSLQLAVSSGAANVTRRLARKLEVPYYRFLHRPQGRDCLGIKGNKRSSD